MSDDTLGRLDRFCEDHKASALITSRLDLSRPVTEEWTAILTFAPKGELVQLVGYAMSPSVAINRALLGRIEWWSEPEKNKLWFRHIGCDCPDAVGEWIVPLDDCPPPSEETEECSLCARVAPLGERS